MKDRLIRSTIRTGIVIAILLSLQYTLQFLPGINALIIQPDITIATVIYSLVALIMFGVIISYATSVGTVLSEEYNSIPNLDRIIQLPAVLIVLAWGYNVFWWIPFFQNNRSLYDLLFLVIGLLILSWLAYLLYIASDSIADHMTKIGTSDMVGTNGDNQSTEAEQYED